MVSRKGTRNVEKGPERRGRTARRGRTTRRGRTSRRGGAGEGQGPTQEQPSAANQPLAGDDLEGVHIKSIDPKIVWFILEMVWMLLNEERHPYFRAKNSRGFPHERKKEINELIALALGQGPSNEWLTNRRLHNNLEGEEGLAQVYPTLFEQS